MSAANLPPADNSMVQADADPALIMLPEPGAAVPPDLSIGLVIAVAAVAAAAALARRRSRRLERDPPHRSSRILRAASAFAVTISLVFVAHVAAGPDSSELWVNLAAMLFLLPAALVGAAFLIGAADFALALLRPRRSRAWLLVAPPLFVVLIGGAMALPVWLAGFPLGFNLHQLLLVGSASAAALTWWSYLPFPEKAVARLFD